MADTDTAVLVGDIGGTNARLAIATPGADSAALSAVQRLHGADYPDLPDVIEAYLRNCGLPRPSCACLSIAGPIRDGVATFTNSSWKADSRALEQRFQFCKVQLLNDFSALAYSVPFLDPQQREQVRAGHAAAGGPISVIGPGTGFGVALLVPGERGWTVVPTEGGHRSFPPTTRRELQLCEELGAFERHLSIENLLSGSGIATIYKTLAAIGGHPPEALGPDEITRRALAGSDGLCKGTVAMFCEMLGAAAGDIALTHGATGGVYLGGGILPKIRPLFLASHFAERFCAKGVMSAYLERIPIFMIDSDYAALTGAALWFHHHARRQ